jgi:hypothetical protein
VYQDLVNLADIDQVSGELAVWSHGCRFPMTASKQQ